MTSRIIQGSYFADLMAQPESLSRLVASLQNLNLQPTLRRDHYQRVVLTGMGSSWHALYPLHRRLSSLGWCSHWIESSELLLGFDSYFSPETLLIAVSQSGESAEIVTLLDHAKRFGHVIGITNGESSKLARAADSTVLIRAGVESTVSCKTYINTLAALLWLGDELSGSGSQQRLECIEGVQGVIEDYLANYLQHVAYLLPMLERIDSIFVTGRGDSLAAAGTGGLILKESTKQHAEGMSCAAFRHGPLEMAGESVLVVIFEGTGQEAGLNRRLASDIKRGGGNAVLVAGDGLGPFKLALVPAELRPLVEILPIQMLSLALAARNGVEAGRFERASKVTNVA